ncbi:MAG: hypothetical protein ACRDKT_17290 [Actinomycetota bacterium]
MPVLFLGHAFLAVVALLGREARDETRTQILQVLSGTGIALAVVLFFAPGAGDTWRTTLLEPDRAHLVGAAVACAWLVLLVLERIGGEGAWDAAVSIGVASSALALFGMNRWSVPALLFWGVAVLALAVLASRARRPGATRLGLALGSAALVAGIVVHALDADAWAWPREPSGWAQWLVIAAAVLMSGAIPGTGGWGLFGSRSSAAVLPLLTGASFLLLASQRSDAPVVAVLVLLLSLACAVVTIARKAVDIRFLGAWVVALMLSLALLDPGGDVAARAGFAAVVGITTLVLWPLSLGRAQIERGIVVAFVAITAGYNAIAGAASVAFEQATATDDVVAAAPWAAFSALLPVALAAGVALGARLGRHAEHEAYTVPGVLATWALFAAAVAWGVVPEDGGGAGVWLYVVAVVSGVGAARVSRMRETVAPETIVVPEGPPQHDVMFDPWSLGRREDGLALRVAVVLGAAAALATLVITYQGLKVGFL